MEYFTITNQDTHQFPLVIDFPHSGTFVPPHIRSRMLDKACLSNTDWFLPELYDFLSSMGCTTIVNHLSRYVVDVNRPEASSKTGNYRDTVVYQQNTQGSPLYAAPLEEQEINERIVQYYRPYHQALENLLQEKLRVFPSVLLLDLHSFFINFANGGDQDVYLSNRCGATSSQQTLQALHKGFEAQGYTVLDNAILGGHSIRHYRELFGERLEAILIELRYTKYIEKRYFGEEEVITRNEALFEEAKKKLEAIFTQLPFLKA